MMGAITRRLRWGLVIGFAAIFATVLWGCGPAAPVVDEPTPVRALQPTAIPTVEPERPPDPTTLAAAPDESLQEPISVVDGRTLSGGEPVASFKQATGSDYEPRRKTVGEDAVTKAGRSDAAGAAGQKQSAQNREYTWQDGDRTLTVQLQDDLTVTGDGEIALRDDTPIRTTRSETDGKVESPGLPVFRSPTGTLMTLPGGVLLALDESWSAAETDAFFEGNGVEQDRVSELEYLTNGFFVETDPGWVSLDLANTLAEQDGVRISSPNWRREVVPK